VLSISATPVISNDLKMGDETATKYRILITGQRMEMPSVMAQQFSQIFKEYIFTFSLRRIYKKLL
jgi:hypothetical protein